MKHFLLIIFSLSIISTSAMSQKSKNWDKAIASIEKSEFMENFMNNKIEIENHVSDFYKSKDVVSKEDFEAIGKEYDLVLSDLDAILNNIALDFTDKESRKSFASHPDKILKGYSYELDQAMNQYENNCAAEMEKLTLSTVGAFGLSEISLIIGLVNEIGKMFSNQIKNTKKMSAEYFENQCLYKYRLRTWDSY